MAWRTTCSPVLVVALSALLTACGTDPGVPPTFVYDSLTHRGGHLVLDVRAVVLPDSAPAEIVCSGALNTRGTGIVRDSVPVAHRDTAVVYRETCTAEADGASAEPAELRYTVYGPDLTGAWVGVGTVGRYTIAWDWRSETDRLQNPSTVVDLTYGRSFTYYMSYEMRTDTLVQLRGGALGGGMQWSFIYAVADFAASGYRTLTGSANVLIPAPETGWLPYSFRRQ